VENLTQRNLNNLVLFNSIHHHCPTQSHNELRNDIRTLIRFFSLVHGEKKFCNDSPLIGTFFNQKNKRRFGFGFFHCSRHWYFDTKWN
jgi:hypothetical protein